MDLQNYMEIVVQSKLDQVLKMFPKCCHCDVCKRDIAILALNHLPPKYISTEKGKIFMQMEESSSTSDAMVVQEIVKAIGIVSEHPRHDG